MYTMEVLNPVAEAEGDKKISKPAQRPNSLDGLTVGLVWNAKRGGLEALTKAGELIANKFKGVSLRRYEGSQPCRKELIEQVIKECDVIVGSTGD